MELASLKPIEVLHGYVLYAKFCKLHAQVGDGTLVGLVQFRSDCLNASLVLLRNPERLVFFLFLEPSVVCFLLGIDFQQFCFEVGNQRFVVRDELSGAQGEHIVLGVHIYADGIFLGDFLSVLVTVAIPSQYEVDVIATDNYCIGRIRSVTITVQ